MTLGQKHRLCAFQLLRLSQTHFYLTTAFGRGNGFCSSDFGKIGQTGRCFNNRVREHRMAVRSNIGDHMGCHCKRCGCKPELEKTKFLCLPTIAFIAGTFLLITTAFERETISVALISVKLAGLSNFFLALRIAFSFLEFPSTSVAIHEC